MNNFKIIATYDEAGQVRDIGVAMPHSSTEDDIAMMIQLLARNPYGAGVTQREPRKLATLRVKQNERGEDITVESKLRNEWGF